VIPKEIREAMEIKTGTRLVWLVRDGKLTVLPVSDDPVGDSIGILKGSGYTFEEFLDERDEERKHEKALEEEEEKRWRAMSSTPRQ